VQPGDLPLPPPAITAEAARRAAEDVLSRPEYAEVAPSLLERVGDAVQQAIGRILAGLGGTGTGSVVAYVVLTAVAVGVLLLSIRAARSLRRDAAGGLATAGDVGRPTIAWLDDAVAHEQVGRWREAVRCRYRALVATLAANGTVEEMPGRTAGEYLDGVRAVAPAAVDAFADATEVFERAWYGRDDVGPADAAALRSASEATALAIGARAERAEAPA
jgi:hypothetical protein